MLNWPSLETHRMHLKCLVDAGVAKLAQPGDTKVVPEMFPRC